MDPERPEIILPLTFKEKSGLYVPTSFAPVFGDVRVPPELEPRPQLLIAGRAPSFYDQVFAYATEQELGFEPIPPDDVVAIARAVQFWPSMRFLTRFQRDLWNVQLDQAGQIAILNQWFGGSEFAKRAEPWLRQERQRVLFSEQQLFALQRLVLLYARDGVVDEDQSQEEYMALFAALFAVPGSMLGTGTGIDEEQPARVEDERWMRLFVGHGGFVGRGALRNELGRAVRLYAQIATSEALRSHPDYCPVDEWLDEELGLSIVELQALGFALHAGSKMLDEREPLVLVDENYFATTLLAGKARAGLDALSATREWFVERFEKTQSDARRAAFEITPFLQRPALRQPDGRVMPLAPRALEAWIGATGAYYRLFDIARGKGSKTRKRFTRFNGAVVETYAAEVVERAYPPHEPHDTLWLPGSVHRDHTYETNEGERRTPDVAIDLTPDLVLIEVTSSRLTEKSIVDADPDAVRKDIQKVVIEKVEQLGGAIRDLRTGVAVLPDVDIEAIERIWPIVVSSEGLFQTPTLWAHVRGAVVESLAQAEVQPLTLLDIEDVEELFGMIVDGHSIIDVLRSKTSEFWRERELASWFRDSGVGDPESSPISREHLDLAFDAIARALFGDEAVAAHVADLGADA